MPKKTYSKQIRIKAKSYYLKDMPIAEISKALDVPLRTMERWQKLDEWVKERDNPTNILP